MRIQNKMIARITQEWTPVGNAVEVWKQDQHAAMRISYSKWAPTYPENIRSHRDQNICKRLKYAIKLALASDDRNRHCILLGSY